MLFNIRERGSSIQSSFKPLQSVIFTHLYQINSFFIIISAWSCHQMSCSLIRSQNFYRHRNKLLAIKAWKIFSKMFLLFFSTCARKSRFEKVRYLSTEWREQQEGGCKENVQRWPNVSHTHWKSWNHWMSGSWKKTYLLSERISCNIHLLFLHLLLPIVVDNELIFFFL